MGELPSDDEEDEEDEDDVDHRGHLKAGRRGSWSFEFHARKKGLIIDLEGEQRLGLHTFDLQDRRLEAFVGGPSYPASASGGADY